MLLNRGRKFAIFDQYRYLSQKWYDTGLQLLLIIITMMISNSKSEVPKVTFDDLE